MAASAGTAESAVTADEVPCDPNIFRYIRDEILRCHQEPERWFHFDDIDDYYQNWNRALLPLGLDESRQVVMYSYNHRLRDERPKHTILRTFDVLISVEVISDAVPTYEEEEEEDRRRFADDYSLGSSYREFPLVNGNSAFSIPMVALPFVQLHISRNDGQHIPTDTTFRFTGCFLQKDLRRQLSRAKTFYSELDKHSNLVRSFFGGIHNIFDDDVFRHADTVYLNSIMRKNIAERDALVIPSPSKFLTKDTLGDWMDTRLVGLWYDPDLQAQARAKCPAIRKELKRGKTLLGRRASVWLSAVQSE